MSKKPILCLMYDFDKTLCTQDMQNFGFIPDMGLTPGEFWGRCGEFSKEKGTEKILSYMYVMIEQAKKKGIPLTKEYLSSTASRIEYYKGVENWFERINKYGEAHGFDVEHYVISSGTKEIIEGSTIYKHFKNVYACEFVYDDKGEAIWPKLVINYTQKTQFVFRISKGATNISDDDKVNERIPHEDRKVEYENMIYIGDGITDIPCMQLIKDKGGHSIAVYNRKYKEQAANLFNDERVNFVCEADYSENSNLEQIVLKIIKLRQVENDIKVVQLKEKKKMEAVRKDV